MKIALFTVLILGQSLALLSFGDNNMQQVNLNQGNWKLLSNQQLQGGDGNTLQMALNNMQLQNGEGDDEGDAQGDSSAMWSSEGASEGDSGAEGSMWMSGDAEADSEGNAESNGDLLSQAMNGGDASASFMSSGDSSAQMSGEMSGETQFVNGGTTVVTGKTQYLRGPTVIRQRLVQQPIIRQRIVQQPIIKRRIVQRKVVRSQQNVAPTESNREFKRNVNITVPAKEVQNTTTVQPTLLTRNTNVSLNRAGSRNVNRQPRVNATQTRNEERVRVVNAPAQQIVHHTRVQPTLHTINQTVRLNQLPTRTVNHDQVVRAVQNRRVNKSQNFNVEANEIHNHRTIRPNLTNIRTQVQLQNSPDQTVNRPDIVLNSRNNTTMRVQNATVPGQKTYVQPVIQYVINENETHHVHKPVFKRVPYLKQITVPTTVLQKNPVIRRVKVPVKTQAAMKAKMRTQSFSVRPSGRASTGWVEHRSMTLPAEGVPVEVNGGTARWEVTGTNDQLVNGDSPAVEVNGDDVDMNSNAVDGEWSDWRALNGGNMDWKSLNGSGSVASVDDNAADAQDWADVAQESADEAQDNADVAAEDASGAWSQWQSANASTQWGMGANAVMIGNRN